MSRITHDAIVVGAGVVGATAALAIARAGFKVALVEARELPTARAIDRDLRVYALSPASIAQFTALGVWEAIVVAGAHAYREMRVWDAADTDNELHFRAGDIGATSLGHIAQQADIQHALQTALQRDSSIDWRCPATSVALDQDDVGVALELDDGDLLRARMLIAADGAASPLRKLVGVDVIGHSYSQRAIVAYVRTELSHADTAWQRFMPGGPLAVLPCDDGLSSIVWTVRDDEAERLLQLDEAGFSAELTRAFDARLGAMTLASKRASFPLSLQLAKHYVEGRVALIGDAAHVVHPLAGQGVNLGLRDVDELVQSAVRNRERGLDVGSVQMLRRYERSRRSENAIAAGAFDAINRVFSNDDVVATLLRGRSLGWAGRITPLRRWLAAHAAGQR
jgi:2-octaprenyl-3-methyl-6-methoxy-1,4-benzoquinol hydroxylase